MARIQQTFVSGSLWIGTGSKAASLFDAYVGGVDSRSFAIYSSSNPLLYFNTNGSPSLVIPITTSINSPLYSSGFLGQGFKISAVPKTIDNVTRYFWTGEFDDLWVRGSMHVKQMVIDQIRATNGSLWITDAGKASSASFVQTVNANAGTMSLYFDTTSTVPFTTSDIIRSKRWIPQGNTIQHQWDFVGGVTSILYNQVENNQTWSVVKITGSKTGTAFSNYYLDGNASDWKSFVDTISVLQSQWVRVGNLTGKAGRTASIYLTSNDAGGPFMDMVSGVSTIAQALGGSTASGAGNTVSVTESRIKMRTGNLQGIYDSNLGGALSGYGLWADNVYLRGKIVANDGGTISNWIIAPNELYSGNVHINSTTNDTFLGFNTTTWLPANSIYIGSGSNGVRFGLSGSADYFWFSNSILTIKTPNFAVDGSGNVSMSGIVSANAGSIGGWTIDGDNISSSGIKLTPGDSPFIGIGTVTYGSKGIWLGEDGGAYKANFYKDPDNYLDWDGSKLKIKAANFQLDQNGVISASGATFSGKVTAESGEIGGWTIGTNQLYSGKVTLSSISGNSYLGIGSSEYDSTGIYIGSKSSGGNRLSLVSGNNKLLWDGSALSIDSPNFTLSTAGNITAKNAVISGSISSSAGQIGGWAISEHKLSGQNESGGQVSLATSGSYWNIIDGYGNANRSSELWGELVTTITNIYNTNSNQATFTKSGGFWQYTGSYGNDPNWQGPYFSMSIKSLHPELDADSNITFTKSAGEQFWKVAVFKTRLNLIRKPDGSLYKMPPSQQAEI